MTFKSSLIQSSHLNEVQTFLTTNLFDACSYVECVWKKIDVIQISLTYDKYRDNWMSSNKSHYVTWFRPNKLKDIPGNLFLRKIEAFSKFQKSRITRCVLNLTVTSNIDGNILEFLWWFVVTHSRFFNSSSNRFYRDEP